MSSTAKRSDETWRELVERLSQAISEKGVTLFSSDASRETGDWVNLAIDARDLIESLQARVEELEPRRHHEGSTHWEGCWKARGHQECAVALVERLERDREREGGEGDPVQKDRKRLSVYDLSGIRDWTCRRLREREGGEGE